MNYSNFLLFKNGFKTKKLKVECILIKYVRACVSGVMLSFLIMIAGSIILATILRFTSMFASHYTSISITIECIALFIGGIFAGKRGISKGWLLGALMSLCIIIMALTIQLFITKTSIEWIQFTYYALYLFFGTLGGIIGVHFTSDE